MKIVGILIGILGALLFTWHMINVLMGTDETRFMSHMTPSLVGGIMMAAGIAIYIFGRRRSHRH